MNLTTKLRAAIEASGKSVYQLAKECDLSAIHIARFLRGERDLRLSSADKLAANLELELVSDAPQKKPVAELSGAAGLARRRRR